MFKFEMIYFMCKKALPGYIIEVVISSFYGLGVKELNGWQEPPHFIKTAILSSKIGFLALLTLTALWSLHQDIEPLGLKQCRRQARSSQAKSEEKSTPANPGGAKRIKSK